MKKSELKAQIKEEIIDILEAYNSRRSNKITNAELSYTRPTKQKWILIR